MDRRDEFGRQRLAREHERLLEVRACGGHVPAEREQLARDRVVQRGGGHVEVEPLRLEQALLGLIPATEPEQVVDAVDVHEMAVRAADPQPGRRALALDHRLERGRVIAAQAQELAEMDVGARPLITEGCDLERPPQLRLPAARVAEVPEHQPSVMRALASASSSPRSSATASDASQRSRAASQRRRPISA